MIEHKVQYTGISSHNLFKSVKKFNINSAHCCRMSNIFLLKSEERKQHLDKLRNKGTKLINGLTLV